MNQTKFENVIPLRTNDVDSFVDASWFNTIRQALIDKFDGLKSFGVPDDVTAYGADNTGATSSNQAVLDCLAENGQAYFPPGDYLLDGFVLNGQMLYGLGKIKRKDASSSHAIIMQGENPRIVGLTFESTTAATNNGDGEIKLDDGCMNPEITGATFKGSLYCCVSADTNGADDSSLTYVNPVDGFVFSGCKVSGAYSRHLYLHNVITIKIIANDFRNSVMDCLRLRQKTKKCIISGNTFTDIGTEDPNIIERPQNWSSIVQYSVGDKVSVPPYGIYECTSAPTIGENPATTGAADWNNISPTYFETKDALDAYWSGEELIITNNIVDKCASFGFDIKGTNPEGTYSSGKVIFQGNIVKNVFGVALNLSFAALDAASKFHYVGEILINNNYFALNNRERFDISQSPITLRQGVRNVQISNNVIEKNFARAVTVANLSGDGQINKGISITNNHVLSNGIPGDPSNIGLNISPCDGLIVSGNTVRNLDKIEAYKMDFEQTFAGSTYGTTENVTIPILGEGPDMVIAADAADTPADLAAKIKTKLESNDYLVPYGSNGTHYFQNVRLNDASQASTFDHSDQMLITSLLTGTAGNNKTVTFIVDNVRVPSVYPASTDFVLDGSNNLTCYVRSSTQPDHFLTAFTSNAPQAVKDVYEFALKDGLGAQSAIGDGVSTLSGGTNASKVYWDSRIKDMVDWQNATGSVNGAASAAIFEVFVDPFASNSVQIYAMSIRDREPVGGVVYEAPKLSYIVKDNIVDNNNANARFNILINYVEPGALIAYVDSDNTGNTATITPMARKLFSNGGNAGADTHLNSQAYLLEQGISLKARLAGAGGNSIGFTIEQPTAVDQILRVLIAPAIYGGSEIKLLLPTDASGNPVAVTVEDAENCLKQYLGQGLMTYENNYLGNGYRPAIEASNVSPIRRTDAEEMATQTITSGGEVTVNDQLPAQIIPVQSDGGEVTAAGELFGSSGSFVGGQTVTLVGVSNTDYPKLVNSDTSKGLIINGAAALTKFRRIKLEYNKTLDRFLEVERNF